jgi:replicative DNA helicase
MLSVRWYLPYNLSYRDVEELLAERNTVLFLYREEIYNENSPDKGIAEVIIAKHRQGATGTRRLAYRGHLTQFVSLP